MKILLINGSLRQNSFNQALAIRAEKSLQGKAEVSFLKYEDIPFMNQDLEFPAPESIERVREQVLQADGIWFFTPEYNYMIPGTLKNLLDWLSRSMKQGGPRSDTAIYGKKACLSGAGGRNATRSAQADLKRLLKGLGVDVMDTPDVQISLSASAFQNQKLSPEDLEKIDTQIPEEADAFLRFLAS